MVLITITIFVQFVYSTDLSKIKFEYLTVDDGLSQGIIEDILQDRLGYMWFATRDGLNRYDGLKFTIFRNDRNDPQSLASNWVFCLAEDHTGILWIGSAGGLNRYDPVTDKMVRIPVNADDPNAFKGGRVLSITVDNDSTIWFSTINGLVHYFPKQDRYKTYTHDPDNSGSISNSNIYSILITRDNRLYAAPVADPINEFDRKTETFREIPYRLAYHGSNNHKYIQEDQQGLLYITSEFSGVHILNPVTGETRLIDKTDGILSANSIKTRVLNVSPSEIWIGTDGGGINIYNPQTGEMQYLMVDTRNNYSLNANSIFKIYQDRDRNIWVGHFGAGISVWKRNKEKFTSYAHSPFNPASINKEVVCGIFEDSKGRIWLGQDGGGLSLFNEQSKSFEHIRYKAGEPGSLTTDVILAFNEDPDGNLLLGTYSGGLIVFDPEAKKVIKVHNSGDGMSSDNVWHILKDSQGRYWLAMLGAGYALFDPVSGTFENYNLGAEAISSCSNVIMNINEDAEGRIWFGTENTGICILDYDKKIMTGYRHDDNNKNSLSYDDVKSIVFTDSYAWIATNGGGLNRLDLKTDSFKVYTINEGLSSNALMGLLKDKDNNLWISSTRGLMRFNTRAEEVEVYDKSQGIQGNEFKYNAQFQLSDGRMMFGGVNGLSVFHPDSIRDSNIKPNVVFTDFKIFGKSITPGTKGSPLKKDINFSDFIKLNHKQSVFTIEFASLDYNSPRKNNYSYMMEGFDEGWVDGGNINFVTYTNLDPGKYTFLLKGSNSDGVYNDTPRKISIRIRPPWYKTKLAIALFLIALIRLVVLYIRRREKQTVQDRIILEQKIRDAKGELEAKVNELEKQQDELKRRDEEEKDIRFFTDGIARFSDIISKKRRNLEDLATSIISELVSYIDASAGAIFIADDSDPEQVFLRATGEFCLSSDKERIFTFEAGEGNIGTCFVEKQTLKVDNIPEGFIVLRSGLGTFSLQHAIYVPIIQDNICVGVIEIASVDKLSDNKTTFVEKIAETLAAVITIIKTNEKTNEILEQNNIQAEELRTQEEEMKQNMEELLATQEESQRKEAEIVMEMTSKTEMIKELQAEIAKLKKK